MTIALAINTNAGAVLATDSAASMVRSDGTVAQVYNNAIKIVNLCKGQPFGVATYGAGSIGPYSIELLAKEFREKLPAIPGTKLLPKFEPDNYQLEAVGERFRRFIFDIYDKEFSKLADIDKPSLGFILTGYSSGTRLPETYVISNEGGKPAKMTRQFGEVGYGIISQGQPEAIDRLVDGFSWGLFFTLADRLKLDDAAKRSLAQLFLSSSPKLIHPAMPLQDAIDLARFLAETAVSYQRFLFDDKTVGGPIDIATMSRYEGFKWVQRKHYYPPELNPRNPRG
jgi:hypothetical protein